MSGLNSDILEVRIIGLYGRTTYKAKVKTTDKKKINSIFNILRYKFDIIPVSMDIKDWF